MNNKREAKFIGTLFVNRYPALRKDGTPHHKAGQLYLKGHVNGQEVYCHYNEKEKKDDPSVLIKSFAVELVLDINGDPKNHEFVKGGDNVRNVDKKQAKVLKTKGSGASIESSDSPF